MKISRNTKAEDAVWDALAKYMAKDERVRAPGLYHVSDLLNPRQTFFRILNPRPIKRDSLGYFTAGRAHHEILQKVLPGTPEHQVKIAEGGITVVGTIDIKMKSCNMEIKTSRKWTIPEVPDPIYVDQLRYYCAVDNQIHGKLLVFYITPGRKFGGIGNSTTPDFRVWDLEFELPELKETQNKLLGIAETLDSCLAGLTLPLMTALGDKLEVHRELPLCQSFLCGSKYKGKTEVKCEYYQKCKPEGRWPEDKLS